MVQKVRVARVSTVIFFVDTQLHDQIKHLVNAGANVTVIASEPALNRAIEHCHYRSVEIPREISLIKDSIALFKLWRLFKSQQYQIVHSTTPKAGLLCAVAGKLAGVPIRLHTFTGQPWVTLTGLKRALVKSTDKLIGRLNTHCYTDSHSQQQFLIEQGVVAKQKLTVMGQGSVAGVDTARFNPSRFTSVQRQALRAELAIPLDATVLLFVGRIVIDKGVLELISAFEGVVKEHPNTYLLMVGPQLLTHAEMGIIEGSILEQHILFTGYTDEPETYMSISALLCLPSYREGFGTVVIEAAAMGIPAVGSNIYGLSDAIVKDKTGLLFEVKNRQALKSALCQLIIDDAYREKLGAAAQHRAYEQFSSTHMNQRLVEEYRALLNQQKQVSQTG